VSFASLRSVVVDESDFEFDPLHSYSLQDS
jgi:hypothetical protein